MGEIFLVQHCQSEHHINELTGGWTDTPLTDLGKKQAEAVVKELKAMDVVDFDLYSSDLKRAKMTADFISSEFNVKINILDLLREINNGLSANKTKEWASENKLYESKKLQIDKPLWLDAETPRELYNRMSIFIDEYLSNITKDIVIVSHGIAIGYLICAWLKISPNKLDQVFIGGNAGGISCITTNYFEQNTLSLFNSTAHLRELG